MSSVLFGPSGKVTYELTMSLEIIVQCDLHSGDFVRKKVATLHVVLFFHLPSFCVIKLS